MSSSTIMHWVFLDAARAKQLYKSLTMLSQLAYLGRNDEVICVSAACLARLWSWDFDRICLKDAAFCSESSKILVECLNDQYMVSSMVCMVAANGTAGPLACSCDDWCFRCRCLSRHSGILENAGREQMHNATMCGFPSVVGHCRHPTRCHTYTRGTQKLELLCSL